MTLPNAEAIPAYLRSLPDSVKTGKLELMKGYRSLMSYDTKMTDPLNAVNVEISGICKRYNAPLENEALAVL